MECILTVSHVALNAFFFRMFSIRFKVSMMKKLTHPAGTSKDSDKCDLSKDSEIVPLTLGSMENTTYFVSHRKAI